MDHLYPSRSCLLVSPLGSYCHVISLGSTMLKMTSFNDLKTAFHIQSKQIITLTYTYFILTI